eukprot:747396-Rhodomonas_salina.1
MAEVPCPRDRHRHTDEHGHSHTETHKTHRHTRDTEPRTDTDTQTHEKQTDTRTHAHALAIVLGTRYQLPDMVLLRPGRAGRVYCDRIVLRPDMLYGDRVWSYTETGYGAKLRWSVVVLYDVVWWHTEARVV